MPARFDHTLPVGRIRFWLMVGAAVLFALVWLIGMTAAMTSKGCANSAKPDVTRLRLCNAAVAVGRFSIFRTEPHKFGQIYMIRGIREANLGHTDAAIADMRRAVDMVTGGRPDAILPFARAARGGALDLRTIHGPDYWPARLVAQTLQPDSSDRARAAWDSIVAELPARP